MQQFHKLGEKSLSLIKVQKWLKKMDIKFQMINESIVLMYNIKNIQFAVNINILGEWIQIAASTVRTQDVIAETREELYADLLKQNFLLNDVTYSLDSQGSIFSENDIPVDSNYENFVSEFNAVVYGVIHFYDKIGLKYGLDEPSEEIWIGRKI